MTKTVSLNGVWMRRVGMGEERECTVPYSTLPVGRSFCRRSFTVENEFERLFLRFEGITYHAEVFLNGASLGEMLPYCVYEFEITDTAIKGENELLVELEDINAPFGPTPGWENFGGIIRGVSLEYRNYAYISDVFFKTELTNKYKDARMKAEVTLDGNWEGDVFVRLLDAEGNTVAEYSQAQGESPWVDIKGVSLWSPDSPYLYTLLVELKSGDETVSQYSHKVGFRELKCQKHRFLFNGAPLFFKGVCKHEMIGDSGHVVTPDQIEEDLLKIKATGSNFVRLVHYPHCKETLEIADRIGLMVSEEPGLWWSDTSDPQVAGGSLEVLKRTVLRDRNHPAIMFWLSFNECRFTEKFLIDSANTCREYDPTRLVSGANCMSDQDTLIYFNKCGFDFYTMHPYSPTVDRIIDSAKVLNDKPLVFTEWGGYHVFDRPEFMSDCLGQMRRLYQNNSDNGALAGAFLWCWADVNDFNRGYPCEEGVLYEGLVTKEREKHICYETFCREIAKFDEPYSFKLLEKVPEGIAAECVQGSEDFNGIMEKLTVERPKQFMSMRPYRLQYGARLRKCGINGIDDVPSVVSAGVSAVYEGENITDKITVIGATGLNKGYPLSGEFGEVAATVTVYFDGGKQTFDIRNGRELTAAYASLGSSRINPVADGVSRFAEFSYDKNLEQYIINRLELKLDGEKKVKRVEITASESGYMVLVYGVFI